MYPSSAPATRETHPALNTKLNKTVTSIVAAQGRQSPTWEREVQTQCVVRRTSTLKFPNNWSSCLSHKQPTMRTLLFRRVTHSARSTTGACQLLPYPSSCLSVYTPRTLRSSLVEKKREKIFLVQQGNLRALGFGYRSFSVQASLVWNNLPAHTRHCRGLPIGLIAPSIKN